jgi:hypothetical protein
LKTPSTAKPARNARPEADSVREEAKPEATPDGVVSGRVEEGWPNELKSSPMQAPVANPRMSLIQQR